MVDVLGDEEHFWEPPLFQAGAWLRSRSRVLQTNECRWLEVLGDFERDGDYSYDGHLTAASWLMWATGMARSTAYEKLRMASQLTRRALVRDAFAAGEISYSAARAICSLDHPDPDVDAALVALAQVGSVVDVEAAVRYYQVLASQDLPPYEPERREVSSRKGHNGLGVFRAVLGNHEVAQLEAALKAFMAARASRSGGAEPARESARADTDPFPTEPGPAEPAPFSGPSTNPSPDSAGAEAQGQSARADTDPSEDQREDQIDPDERVDDWKALYGTNRADALMEMVSLAMANLGGTGLGGADRYMVHVVTDLSGLRGEETGIAELVDGSVLPAASVARMACDASFVAHLLADGSEPLSLGRRVRDWTPAQRRAVKVRDRGRCRFPGCGRSHSEIHHITEWSEGGPTDIANAASLCGRHHVLVHQGFKASGNGNAEVVFHRPDGSVLGSSTPSRRPPTLRRWANHGPRAA